MVCPLYIDFTRMCIQKFPDVVRFATLNFCDSEQYVDCPIYVACTSDFICEFALNCIRERAEKMPEFFKVLFKGGKVSTLIKESQINYCLSPEMSKTCARYQLLSKGEIPPINLIPDGHKIGPLDLLLGRKLIVHPPE